MELVGFLVKAVRSEIDCMTRRYYPLGRDRRHLCQWHLNLH